MSQGLTQMSLALEAGLSRNMIIGIEWGQKSLAYERLWDIADVLGVEVQDLFSNASSEPSSKAHRSGSSKGSTRTRLSVDPEAK